MLVVDHVSFSYQEKITLKNINFKAKKGEHISIIGESGSGKSTLLKSIYGLLQLNEGKITWNGEELLGPDFNLIPGHLFMKYVAQDFELMPFTTVAENVGTYFARGDKKGEDRVKELIEIMQLEDFADTKVKNLSGGQQQRVALAKALATKPEVLLLDEPFNQVDHFLKNSLRRALFAYLKKEKIMCFVATHDMTDALSYSDTTIVLKDGEIKANNSPKKLYEKPNDRYIALLFGEVNDLNVSDVWKGEIPSELKNKSFFCYPHDLRKSKIGTLKVNVVQSYYRGDRYLVKSRSNKKTVFFFHKNLLKTGLEVSLFISKETIAKRIVN
ncbi:ABC transporter ATP-binding protein [Spongiivirga citrea]|uniref:ATP-binding cassette domain-containing protein n=1 Tax=Spongiivirga citrea TaxID=1481457 RepID=A0A6M0CI91_9FLAO|nr:ABC transporter ATP-binding protein [Spongiivirga citrea]NER17242.1 ATP-binding cassette domain-containing protein [Spongiivirga citrea]